MANPNPPQEDVLEEAIEDAGMGTAVPQPPHSEKSVSELNKGLITVSVMAATIMQAIDSTIANVALPKMQGTLSATQDQMSWVLTSYIIAAAIMIPLTGWLAGRFGRKKVFLISIMGFTIASALCGLATSLPEIVIFRLLQGMSGAALVPLSQAVLFDINRPEDFGKAMAIWGVGVTMGPILGPMLGGWLTEDYSWRWVFYINVPIGIMAFLSLSASMPETVKHNNPFDFYGFISLSLGLGGLQMMLDRGELKGWFGSTEIMVEALIAITAFYLFIIHTLTHKQPFLSPKLFKDRNFVTANVFIFLVGVVLFATLALVPPMLQHEMGYPVMTTGMVTAPRGAGTMLAMMLVGRLSGKVDARLIMACGLGLTAFSLWQMTNFSLLMSENLIITSGFIQGFGIGLAYVPLSTLAFATLSPALRNEGTAFFNLLRNIGSAIGISIVQTLLTQNTQILHSHMVEHITPYNLGDTAFYAHHLNPNTQAGLQSINHMVTKQAAMIAYINDYKLMMVITLAVIPLLLLLRKPNHAPSKEHTVME
ncbi:DHA2 family efflux MFS transporter permease subunit [Acinetobacter sp. VNH17]|uniref:DHA2 family efflux MFS transporter permease subunit n=1 Tax=Acinetobacter thutiue TaxID=2998078 RepID=A0ABT7WQ06_9GAMM|nr:DHA2 family efflux MFS transporter permease subunit [Acinetobacter thutiue]MCY6412638.1 DHA2 family efflux MFS transporter permease subunit [Acinetobacter thutiue]MDN0014745.1 DHA2 family efflux MFS transporter permease subunit [Acinetobacter thutiue]